MGKPALGIGIVGAGTVGGGVIQILSEKQDYLAERAGIPLELLRVADIDTGRPRLLGVPQARITSSFKDIITDDNIQVVLELVGGTSIAFEIVQAALKAGKGVITANKALLAERGKELFPLAKEAGVPLLFEAAVCGAIPIVQAIRDGFVANHPSCILGIVNGTCNYILTQMQQHGQDYHTALAEAQRLGYAEADPTFDVGGIDSAHKLSLLSALAFKTF
ncbi:MAG: homoserine dehydrogenase, partial [Planctomycetes bacterium]|nr:homoserine dehydrogenase [Planctomycetota bacterium]